MIPLPPAVYKALGAALLLALVLLWGTYERSRANSWEARAGVLTRELGLASEALTGKEAVVADLRTALASWSENAEKQGAAIRAAGDRAAAAEEARSAAERVLRGKERTDDQLPDCETLLQSDLAAACPARAAGVRERSQDRLP